MVLTYLRLYLEGVAAEESELAVKVRMRVVAEVAMKLAADLAAKLALKLAAATVI